MVQLYPYLNFNGQGQEAMQFYQSVLGGDLKIQTYEESGQAKKPEENNLLMHGELRTDNGIIFYAADGNEEHKVEMGNSVHMSLQGDDEELLTKYFNGLSEGGNVEFPLSKQFWGDTFGMFTDKFGIHWMVNITSKERMSGGEK